jgi:hypothetical protein
MDLAAHKVLETAIAPLLLLKNQELLPLVLSVHVTAVTAVQTAHTTANAST